MWHMILLIILQISEIYHSFLLSVQSLVLLITCKHHFMEILFYLTFPWTNPWKYVSKSFDKKHISLVCIDRWKSDIAAFLKLNSRISMTHTHPVNRKIGSPFVPPGETKFWNLPLWSKDYKHIFDIMGNSRLQSGGPVTTESLANLTLDLSSLKYLQKKLAPMTLAKMAAEFVRSLKSKMAAGGHIGNVTWKQIDIESCVIAFFLLILAWRIHFWHRFCILTSPTTNIQDDRQ